MLVCSLLISHADKILKKQVLLNFKEFMKEAVIKHGIHISLTLLSLSLHSLSIIEFVTSCLSPKGEFEISDVVIMC